MSNIYVACLECPSNDSLFPSILELEAHIASFHLNFCPYECEKCRYAKFPTEYALISHCKSDHGVFEFPIKYRYSQEYEMKKNELTSRVQNCVKVFEARQFAANNQTIKIEETPPIPPTSPLLPQYAASISSPAPVLALSEEDAKKSVRSFLMGTKPGSSKEHRIEKVCRSEQLDCALCGETIANQRSSMIYHANTRHSKYDIYECAVCHKTWQTIAKSDVVKHVKTHHESAEGAADLSIVIDNRKKMGDKLRIATLKCFPYKKWRTRPSIGGASPESNSPEHAMENEEMGESGNQS